MAGQFYRRCLRRTFGAAWSAADSVAALLAVGGRIVLQFRPGWEATLQELAWQMPVVALLLVGGVRLLRSPLEVYREDMAEKDEEIDTLNEQVDNLRKRLIPWLGGQITKSYFMEYDSDQTLLLLKATVRNRGAQTVVEGWPLNVVLPDGTDFRVEPVHFEKVPEFRFRDGQRFTFDQDDYIYEKTGTPIARGDKVEGFLTYIIDVERERVNDEDSSFALSVSDNDGKVYAIPYKRGEELGPAHHPSLETWRPVDDQGE